MRLLTCGQSSIRHSTTDRERSTEQPTLRQTLHQALSTIVYSGVYHTPLHQFSIVDIDFVYIPHTLRPIFDGRYLHSWHSVGAQNDGIGNNLAESFPKPYRSVLAPA